MSQEPVLVAVDGPIATLTLNRPEVGNAIDLVTAQSLLQAAIRCKDAATVRCVVLTANGRLFCGGGDIVALAGAGDGLAAHLSELVATFHAAVSCLMRMRKPLVVLVNGPAAGGGLSLSLIGDIVLAARSAHFTTAYAGVGLSPDGGLSWHLPRLVGMRRAQEMLLTDRRITTEEAQAMGLITRAVDDAQLAAEGAIVAARLAAGPTVAFSAARTLLLDSFNADFESQLKQEMQHIIGACATRDGREGVVAAVARRKPDFCGN